MRQKFNSMIETLKSHAENNKGSAPIMNLAVTILIAALVLPIALDQFFGVNVDAWSSTAQTVWTILPVLALVGLVTLFLSVAKGKAR